MTSRSSSSTRPGGTPRRLWVGAEIGGTFTDLAVVDDEGELVATHKVFSTPRALGVGVMTAIEESGFRLEDVAVVVHGSTVATNAVLERRGAVTGLVVTSGFRDLLIIQRQSRQRLFDLFYKQPEPLVPRRLVAEAVERVGPSGDVLVALDEEQAARALTGLLHRAGVESVAVCLLHSYRNPAHERRLGAMIAELRPEAFVTLSSDVLPEFREYERASTTVMSAYVRPIVGRYLADLDTRLRRQSFSGAFFVMQSNGGMVPVAAATGQAVTTILSGPSAGVTGAVAMARTAGIDNAITLDMGGTSTDVCLVHDGAPAFTSETMIGGLPLRVPMLNIVTVGAGGGSIAWQDQGGILRVGPKSAGADPGPACYGRGGREPTVTDANVILGLIRPGAFLGGRVRLDVDRARAALAPLAASLGFSVPELADGIVRIANSSMARAIELVSTEKGYDPRDYALVAFGGAGPLHAAALAQELHIEQVLVPPHAGVLSAYGLLMADLRRDYVTTSLQEVTEGNRELLSAFGWLGARAKGEFEGYRLDRGVLTFAYALDMRYAGQAYELAVPISPELASAGTAADLRRCFEEAHRKRYAYVATEKAIHVVNYRLVASLAGSGVSPKLHAPAAARRRASETAPVLMRGREVPVRFCSRRELPVGTALSGPVVIEDTSSTAWVPEGWRVEVQKSGCLLVTRTDP